MICLSVKKYTGNVGKFQCSVFFFIDSIHDKYIYKETDIDNKAYSTYFIFKATIKCAVRTLADIENP